MKLIKTNTIIEKKSKFISYYYQIDNIDEIDKIINDIKKDNKKARHVVYAYKINNIIKKNNDGEPNGTAGDPILTVIDKNNLDNVLIVVVRYFGGIKLGRGLLTRTYLHSASSLLK